MHEVLLTNVFFIITGTAVILVTLLLVVIFFQIIRILRRLEEIVQKAQSGAQHVAEDVAVFRKEIANGGIVVRLIGQVLESGAYHARGFTDAYGPKPARKAARKKSARKTSSKKAPKKTEEEDYQE